MIHILAATLLSLGPASLLCATTFTAVLDRPSVDPGFIAHRFFASAQQPFSADLTSDKLIEIVYTAPAGYHFRVEPPGSNAEVFPSLRVCDDPCADLGQFIGGELFLEGLTGTAPAVGEIAFLTQDDGFSILGSASLTSSISFTGIRLTVPVPASYNRIFTGEAARSQLAFVAGSNPGQAWVFLEPDATTVPEPSGATLLLLGSALISIARRRLSR